MGEKVEYHANERARDMQELVERCQTRLTKVEIQQQQTPSHEALDNITARQIFGKLINLLMSVLALLLVFVSTISGMLQPFTRSPNRVIITLCVTLVAVFFYKHWESLSNWNSNTWYPSWWKLMLSPDAKVKLKCCHSILSVLSSQTADRSLRCRIAEVLFAVPRGGIWKPVKMRLMGSRPHNYPFQHKRATRLLEVKCD